MRIRQPSRRQQRKAQTFGRIHCSIVTIPTYLEASPSMYESACRHGNAQSQPSTVPSAFRTPGARWAHGLEEVIARRQEAVQHCRTANPSTSDHRLPINRTHWLDLVNATFFLTSFASTNGPTCSRLDVAMARASQLQTAFLCKRRHLYCLLTVCVWTTRQQWLECRLSLLTTVP
jgi:hypothetical protein